MIHIYYILGMGILYYAGIESNDTYLSYSRDGHVISGIASNDTYLLYYRDGHVISGIESNDTYLLYSRDGHIVSCRDCIQ